jgi:hypothetical protein
MTADILAFLRERLDEDEQSARACQAEVGATRAGEPYPDGSGTAEVDDFPSYPWGLQKHELAHIARHDPARVLREVEGKRALLGQYEAVCAEVRDPKSADHRTSARSRQFQLEQALPLLALPYSDHADYRQEWAP